MRDAGQACGGASCPSSWFPPPDLTVPTCQVGEASPRPCIVVALGTEGASFTPVGFPGRLAQALGASERARDKEHERAEAGVNSRGEALRRRI